MTLVSWMFAALVLAPSPEVRLRVDRRHFDGDRYVSICVGLFQKPETWTCAEVRP